MNQKVSSLRPPRSALLVTVLLITACATPKNDESAYDRGVQAYKTKNFVAARREWSTAVRQGNHTAENNLGFLLYEGLGGTADVEQAVSLWRKAAAEGVSESQWHLGNAYLTGKGVVKDTAQAYAWFRCAIATAELPGSRDDQTERQIASDAHRSLNDLLGSLSTEDFQHGEQQAQECIRAHARTSGSTTP